MITALSAIYHEEKRHLMGFCLVKEDLPHAVVRVALNATNRFVELIWLSEETPTPEGKGPDVTR